MDIRKFNELLAIRGDEFQHFQEWQGFLEFASGYFQSRRIANPVVVEIGIYRGASRVFYERLLHAEYVGIDIDPATKPDILGNSNDLTTKDALTDWLEGRRIDLLFIDGDHSYVAARKDYELYSPMVEHIVALHDTTKRRDGRDSIEVHRLWQELQEVEYTMLFRGAGWVPQGTGLVIFSEGAPRADLSGSPSAANHPSTSRSAPSRPAPRRGVFSSRSRR